MSHGTFRKYTSLHERPVTSHVLITGGSKLPAPLRHVANTAKAVTLPTSCHIVDTTMILYPAPFLARELLHSPQASIILETDPQIDVSSEECETAREAVNHLNRDSLMRGVLCMMRCFKELLRPYCTETDGFESRRVLFDVSPCMCQNHETGH